MTRCIIAGVIVTFLLGVLQTTLSGPMSAFGVAPDLLLLWAVCIGLLSGSTAGALIGFGAGLLEGALQQAWIGAYVISKMLSGFTAGLLATRMFRENWLVPAVCAAVLTLVNEAAFLLISGAGEWGQAGRILGVRVGYHAVLAPIFFTLTLRVRRALMGRREEAV